jgi:hypothetical protein
MSSTVRTMRLLTLAVGGAVMLTGLARAQDGHDDHGHDAPSGPAAADDVAVPSFAEDDAPPEAPVCWSGLPALGITTDLADLPRAIQAALWADDQELLDFLRDRLTELVGADPTRAGLVLDWIAGLDSREVIAVLAEGLSSSEAVHLPAVRDRLLAMAANVADLEHQAAALAMLGTQRTFDQGTIERLAEVALTTPEPENSLYAVKTLGEVMRRDCGEGCGRYVDGVLKVGTGSADLEVQRFSVEMVADLPRSMSDQAVGQLDQMLQQNAVGPTRQLASLAIARTGRPDRALEIYRRAFFVEPDFCTRVAFFRDAAAAAGARALPLMAEFAAAEPDLKDDYALFADLYGRGVVAYDRIVFELFDKVHLDCTYAQEGPVL